MKMNAIKINDEVFSLNKLRHVYQRESVEEGYSRLIFRYADGEEILSRMLSKEDCEEKLLEICNLLNN